MPRPRKCRRIGQPPAITVFKPHGPPGANGGLLRGVVLPLDGLEAMRLVDALGLDQETAAAQMGVSRATLGRMLAQARSLVAQALTSGWAIRIESHEAVVTSDEEVEHRCMGRKCCQRFREIKKLSEDAS